MKSIRRKDIIVKPCENKKADEILIKNYWMPRIRRSRRLSYSIFYNGEEVAWIQCADPFGTKLAKPLQFYDVQDAIELCRGYFKDSAPKNTESCAIGKVLRRIPNDWYDNFSVIKKIAIIYQDIDFGQKGVVYKALGFQPYALCVRARHYKAPTRGNTRGNKLGTKIVWARSLRRVNGCHYSIKIPKLENSTELFMLANSLPN